MSKKGGVIVNKTRNVQIFFLFFYLSILAYALLLRGRNILLISSLPEYLQNVTESL